MDSEKPQENIQSEGELQKEVEKEVASIMEQYKNQKVHKVTPSLFL